MWNCLGGGSNTSWGLSDCIEFVCGWEGTVTSDCIDCYGDFGNCMSDECLLECNGGWDDDCEA